MISCIKNYYVLMNVYHMYCKILKKDINDKVEYKVYSHGNHFEIINVFN